MIKRAIPPTATPEKSRSVRERNIRAGGEMGMLAIIVWHKDLWR
jgi:hypothetical protein